MKKLLTILLLTWAIAGCTRSIDEEKFAYHENLYVTNGGSHDVTVIDARTWTVITTVQGEFAQPDGIVIAGDGRLVFVANHNTDHVMTVGGVPMAMPMSSSTAAPGRVIVIDAKRRAVLRRVDTAPDGAGLGIAGGKP